MPHPGLDRAEGVLDGAAAKRHRIGVPAQPFAHRVDQMLVLPSGDPAFRACGASALQRAGLAFVDPVSPDLNTAFLGGVAVDKFLASRADIDIAFRIIGKIGLHIHALDCIARGGRARHGRSDARLMAGEDFGAAEVTLVGDRMQVFAVEGLLGCDCHRAELVAVEALVRDLVRDDDVALRIDGSLHIVANHAAVPGAGGHGTGVRIG